MGVLIGYAIILVCVFGGFVLEGGHLHALWQPVELLMIGGAAAGAFVAGTTGKKIKKTMKALASVFKSGGYDPQTYSQLLMLLYEIIAKSKKDGMIALEQDCEVPNESPIFSKYEAVMSKHPYAVEFITDYLRLIIAGNSNPVEIEACMDHEIVTAKHELAGPAHVVAKIGDGMPAFGIVAAVMGVVHTMSSVASATPAQLGEMIASALVGTFLGILLSYGFIVPLSNLIEQRVDERIKMLECIKVVLLAMLHNYAAQVAVEFGRKSMFSTERPSFAELEEMIKAAKSGAKVA